MLPQDRSSLTDTQEIKWFNRAYFTIKQEITKMFQLLVQTIILHLFLYFCLAQRATANHTPRMAQVFQEIEGNVNKIVWAQGRFGPKPKKCQHNTYNIWAHDTTSVWICVVPTAYIDADHFRKLTELVRLSLLTTTTVAYFNGCVSPIYTNVTSTFLLLGFT